MRWTSQDYPVSMKNLKPTVRNKAIEVANALIAEDYDEQHAVPIAITTAKKWAESDDYDGFSATHQLHVIPHPNGWAIRRANADKVSFVFEDRDLAQNKALQMAEAEHGSVIVYNEDGEVQRHIIPASAMTR